MSHLNLDETLRIWQQGFFNANKQGNYDFTLNSKNMTYLSCDFLNEEGLSSLRSNFKRRCDIMFNCFNGGKLPKEQASSLIESCVKNATECGIIVLDCYANRLMKVKKACESLLIDDIPRKIKKKKRKVKYEEPEDCIICLDAARNFVYQPCGHIVSCKECATALRHRSNLCPWCSCILI